MTLMAQVLENYAEGGKFRARVPREQAQRGKKRTEDRK